MNNSHLKYHFFVFLFLSVVIFFYLNTHLDEFIIFRDLEYLNPNFYLNKFQSGFNESVKIFPFDIKVPLPYVYTGNLQGILFYPFYLLFPIEIAKFIYSIISLMIIFYLLNKCFVLDNYKKWLLVFFIPLYVTVLHDSGPVNIGIISFLISKILIEKIFQFKSISNYLFLSFLLITCWSLGFYDKQFYLFIFPSVFIFSFANVDLKLLFTKRIFLLVLPITGFIGFVLFYMFGYTQIIDYNQIDYHPILLQTRKAIGGTNELSSLVKFFLQFPGSISNWPSLNDFFLDRLYVFATWINSFDFSFYLVRNLNSDKFYWLPINISFFIGSYLFLFFLLFFAGKGIFKILNRGVKANEIKPLIYFLSFFVLTTTFLVLGKVRAPHHFIFIWLPLLGMIFDNDLKISKSFMFLTFYSISFLVCAFNFIKSDPPLEIHDSYQSIVKFTQRDNPKMLIVNFDAWSHSITRKLDNPNNHIVTWMDPRNTIQIDRLIRLSDSLKVPIIEVSNKVDWGYDLDGKPYPPISPGEKMKIFINKGFKVKKINTSEYIPIFYIYR